MDGVQSHHVAQRANLYVKSQLDHIRCWLLHCGEHFGTMLSKENSVKSHDGDDSLNLVSNFESLLVEFQTLLIWENPVNSALALTIFTCFYWIVILLSPRIFSIIAVLVFCYHFYEMWTRYVWPEIRVASAETKENWTAVNPNVLSAPEIQNYLAKLKNLLATIVYEIVDLRRRSHGTFCFLSISSLGLFYILGRIIPGVILVYFFAILFFLTPGFLLHVLPKQVLDALLEYCNNLGTHQEVSYESQSECKLNDLDLGTQSINNESNSDVESKSNSPSPFKSQFYEHFFASDKTKSPSSSSSDICDDFELISETDLCEMDSK